MSEILGPNLIPLNPYGLTVDKIQVTIIQVETQSIIAD